MKCGVCGDNYKSPRPRENENTGKYGVGVVVRTYCVGQVSCCLSFSVYVVQNNPLQRYKDASVFQKVSVIGAFDFDRRARSRSFANVPHGIQNSKVSQFFSSERALLKFPKHLFQSPPRKYRLISRCRRSIAVELRELSIQFRALLDSLTIHLKYCCTHARFHPR